MTMPALVLMVGFTFTFKNPISPNGKPICSTFQSSPTSIMWKEGNLTYWLAWRIKNMEKINPNKHRK